jgi:hypothetical protein
MCISSKENKGKKQGIKIKKGEEQNRVRGNDGDKNVPNTVIKNRVRKEGKMKL